MVVLATYEFQQSQVAVFTKLYMLCAHLWYVAVHQTMVVVD